MNQEATVSQNKKIKHRTVAYPHRILNKTSIYLLNTCFDQNESLWKHNGTYGIVELGFISLKKMSIMDAKVFDYTLSKIQESGLKNLVATLELNEILDEFGLKKRTENRNMIYNHLKNMKNIAIRLNWYDEKILLRFLESVQLRADKSSVVVLLSKSFTDAMSEEIAKCRYVNISYTIKSKSLYTVELGKFLQMKGQGVHAGNGEPHPVKEISHNDICTYLSLNNSTKSSLTQIRKSMNELESLGYPKYKFSSALNAWKSQTM